MTLFKNKYRIESIRLKGWDYSTAGFYFVTICTRDRLCFFGEVKDGEMELSSIGEIACQFWFEIPRHCQNTEIDEFVIMPNHVHGIVVIKPQLETLHAPSAQHAPPPYAHEETLHATSLHVHATSLHVHATSLQVHATSLKAISPKAGSLGAIIRSYKSAVSRWCGMNEHPDFGWQSRYYDRILRNEQSLYRARQYIINNPLKWDLDRNRTTDLYV